MPEKTKKRKLLTVSLKLLAFYKIVAACLELEKGKRTKKL